MVGATRPHEAAPGTIRGDFALETAQNLIHASDGAETAATELALWFEPGELVEYDREIDRWALAPGSSSSCNAPIRTAESLRPARCSECGSDRSCAGERSGGVVSEDSAAPQGDGEAGDGDCG